MKFLSLAKYLEELEKTSSRIEITKILSKLLKEAGRDEVDKVTYLVLGQLAPGYKGIVFNMADKMIIRVLAQAYGQSLEKVIAFYKKSGDLGSVAENMAFSNKKNENKGESVLTVYDELLKIAQDEGEKSQERKVENMANLLTWVTPISARFIVRITLGRLRLGFSDKTILDAISWMENGDKSGKRDLEKAYFVLPDVGLLVKRVKELGIKKATKEIKPIVGVPVLPMLAQRIKDPTEMIKKMVKVGVEPKLDGLRLQIHFKKAGFSNDKNDTVKAFTRNLNENSWMFPELGNVGKQIDADEVILDSEAVGLDEATRELANFQSTMTRRRKHEIEETVKKIGIEFFVFDIISLNGRSLLNEKYQVRRNKLLEIVHSGKLIKLVDSEETNDSERISQLYRQMIKDGFEGIVVKAINSTYFSGRTGWRWVKMKQEAGSSAKLIDTLDLVVMGYTLGKGKRAGFGVGQFLVGVVNGDKILTTTKIGTGLTDDQFRELSSRLRKLTSKEKPKEYEAHKNYTPDFWVTPSLVVEIAADEITKSPTHTAGLALRFPRLIKFRDDKNPSQATTLKELKKFFEIQKSS